MISENLYVRVDVQCESVTPVLRSLPGWVWASPLISQAYGTLMRHTKSAYITCVVLHHRPVHVQASFF